MCPNLAALGMLFVKAEDPLHDEGPQGSQSASRTSMTHRRVDDVAESTAAIDAMMIVGESDHRHLIIAAVDRLSVQFCASSEVSGGLADELRFQIAACCPPHR
ncbi:hypothetical protein GN958_ATG12976 [Phytophthora infestans]|uniref:Uncharacterized protein n=1 Tax=Phytophthora infestans TaxID=4787 RepID=A0A8S9UBZ3_PHYIN|nr:hypothetical protein GN958_ATG12976 [Phytophthora infestans]